MASNLNLISNKIEQEKLDEIYDHFKEIGCCHYCCLRFTGVTEAKYFVNDELKKSVRFF